MKRYEIPTARLLHRKAERRGIWPQHTDFGDINLEKET